MIHSRMVKPRGFPWKNRDPEQINRLQEITGDLALNRDKVYEIGRRRVLDYRKRTPTNTGRLRVYESGGMAFWRALANLAEPGTGDSHVVTLDNMQDTIIDIATFQTDDTGVFSGTIWFPKLRVTGFTLNIGDPDAILERQINVIGEKAIILENNYLGYKEHTVSGTGYIDEVIAITPTPLEYAGGKFIVKVLRIRSNVASELIEDENISGAAVDTYAYNSISHDLTVRTCLNGDVIKVFFEAATAYTTTWLDDDLPSTILLAEYCEVNIKFGSISKIYRLQSLGLDATFTRTDYKEIGNSEFVQFGVKDQNVRISLNRYEEGFSLEKLLAGNTAYPYIDPSDFVDSIQVQIKVFKDKAHLNFGIGYLMTNMSPASIGTSLAVQDYQKLTTTIEGDNVTISDVESEIAFV